MRTSRKNRRRLRAGRLALVLVGTLATGGAVYGLHVVQTSRNAGSLRTRAEQAMTAGDAAAAARLYKSYVKFRPNDADAGAAHAAALDKVSQTNPGVYPELVQVYERLLRADPGRFAERRKLVDLYMRAQAYANARSHLAQLFSASKQAADDPELHDLAAKCDERERQFPAAADHLRKVVASETAPTDAFVRLAAITRAELGGAEAVTAADALLDGLVRKRPADKMAWLARAEYRLRFNNKAGARQDVEHVYQTLPGGADDPAVIQTLADLYLDADDLPAAEKVLQKAVGRADTPTRVRLALADVQLRSGRTDTARQTLREAAEKAPAADVALLEVADRLIDVKELAAAQTAADRLTPLQAVGPVSEYLRGRLKLATAEWAEATALLRTAAEGLDKLPNQRFRAYLGLADAAAQANDTPARLAALDAALRLNPGAGIARLARADALAKLGRTREAEEAFQGLANQEPAARAAMAGLRLAEQMALPAAERRWEAVDVACGSEPYPAEVAVIKAKSLVARGRTAEAIALLDKATNDSPLVDPVVELATLKAATGDRAGAFAVLDRAAAREVGDRAAFRLTRGRILARDKEPDWAAIARLGDLAGLGQLPKDERYKLLGGLADVYAGANKLTDAVGLWKRAAAERPTDLVSRAALFNLALATNDAPLQSELIAEFERIEGPGGPVRTAAEAAKLVPTLKPGDPAIAAWKDKLTAARDKRAGWGMVHHLIGRLDDLAGNRDAASESYRKAFDAGERADQLVRALYASLLGRQRYAEAFEVLGKVGRERSLPDDLAKELLRLQVAFGDDPAKALAWANSAEASASPSDRDQLLRADAMLAAGKAGDAVGPLQKAVAANPKNAIAWVGLTRLQMALGKEVDAKATATEAADKLGKVEGAEKAAALVAVGNCRELVGDRPAAEASYRAAVTADAGDVPARIALVRLLARTERGKDAEEYLRQSSASAPPVVQRWARRELAFAAMDRPDWYGRMGTALGLVEQNLAEGGSLPEDKRAKAVIVGADPLRTNEAVALLADSVRDGQLTQDQSYQLARLYLRQNLPAKAEAALRDAARSAPVPAPELLGLLTKVQIEAKSVAAARKTMERLKQLDPKAPETGVAEARVLAAEGKKNEAANRLAALLATPDPTALAGFAGPLLEDMGCPVEAEAVYRRAAGPAAPLRLASFYLRQKRPEPAVRALLPGDGSAPVGLSARLLAGAVRSQPARLLPEPERSNWEKVTREVTDWVQAKLAAAPGDPHLLAAAATLTTVGDSPGGVVPAFERALAAAPNDPTAKANLAFARAVYARDGGDTTLTLIRQAVEAAGPAPAMLDTRGLVHVVGGRADEAIKDLSAAFALEPKPGYAFHLAQAYDLLAAGKAEYARLRDDTLNDAIRRRGLTKAVLDPREWAEFERLTAPPAEPKR